VPRGGRSLRALVATKTTAANGAYRSRENPADARDFVVIERHQPTPNITTDQHVRAYPQVAVQARIELGNRRSIP
jgi:hypothetical protein